MQYCNCGCGEQIPEYNKYKLGHAGKEFRFKRGNKNVSRPVFK